MLTVFLQWYTPSASLRRRWYEISTHISCVDVFKVGVLDKITRVDWFISELCAVFITLATPHLHIYPFPPRRGETSACSASPGTSGEKWKVFTHWLQDTYNTRRKDRLSYISTLVTLDVCLTPRSMCPCILFQYSQITCLFAIYAKLWFSLSYTLCLGDKFVSWHPRRLYWHHFDDPFDNQIFCLRNMNRFSSSRDW